MNHLLSSQRKVSLGESIACLPLKKSTLLVKQLYDIVKCSHNTLSAEECITLTVGHIDMLFEIVKKYEDTNSMCVFLSCRILATILNSHHRDDLAAFFWKDFNSIERVFRLCLTSDFNLYCVSIINSVIYNRRFKLETFCGLGKSRI